MRNIFYLVLLFVLSSFSLIAEDWKEDVPKDLQPWIPWVTRDFEAPNCVPLYNNVETRICSWRGVLKIDLVKTGGIFRQEVVLKEKDTIVLPGSKEHWPTKVFVNDVAHPLINQGGRPALLLDKGAYSLRGIFLWKRLPSSLLIPADSSLLHLRVNDQDVMNPAIGTGGKVWIGREQVVKAAEDSLSVQIFRKITDSLPATLESSLLLEVSGKNREIELPDAALVGEIFRLESPLPVRVDRNGVLFIQVRPGKWTVTLESKLPSAPQSLALPERGEIYPTRELWSFVAQPELRTVRIEGGKAISPDQTQIPADWKRYPLYMVKAGERMNFVETARGGKRLQLDQLSLQKEIWMSFDGSFYTVKDQFNGTIGQSGRLEVQGGTNLGRVAINNIDQFITQAADSPTAGVEVREGPADIEAESRIADAPRVLDLIGWKRDVNSLTMNLHLPPGWQLFNVVGVDTVSKSWIGSWTLLDIFFVLVVTAGCYKLLSPLAALIFFVGLILLEPEISLAGVFFFLILLKALFQVLTEGKLYKLLRFFENSTLLVLVLVLLGFSAQHLRDAIYPQLGDPVRYSSPSSFATPVKKKAITTRRKFVDIAEQSFDKVSSALSDDYEGRGVRQSKNQYLYDSSNLVQTGFGLSSWTSQSIRLSWNGPVTTGETLQFQFISPKLNLFLSFFRVIMAFVFLFYFIPRSKMQALVPPAKVALLCFLAFSSLSRNAYAQSPFPSEKLLGDLRAYALQEMRDESDCKENCTALQELRLSGNEQSIELALEIHSEELRAMPLPKSSEWRLHEVVSAGQPLSVVSHQGYDWIYIDAGITAVQLRGTLATAQSVSFDFLQKPQRIVADIPGWKIWGVDKASGSLTGNLRIERREVKQRVGKATKLVSSSLPSLYRIRRTVTLGIDWSVETSLKRLSPLGSSLSAQLPLLPGESVTSSGVLVQDGSVRIQLGPKDNTLSWTSRLEKQDKIVLTASKEDRWSEVWMLDASNLWSVDYSGTPRIFTAASMSSGLPEWHPRPGEQLTVVIDQPAGIDGPTKTIDRADYNITIGRRAYDATLSFDIRASQGDRHVVKLDPKAQLVSVSQDSRKLPLELKEGALAFDLQPGKQKIEIKWREARPIQRRFSSPNVDLGLPAVNVRTTMKLPQSRWVLWAAGPLVGPAILFWAILPLLLLLAFVLGRWKELPFASWQWFLLLLGLSQTNFSLNVIIVGWIIALTVRGRSDLNFATRFRSRIVQIALAFWSVIALSGLFQAIQDGLLGSPNMIVRGNRSTSHFFSWYQDHITGMMPECFFVSYPILYYRIVMLLWALWLAITFLKFLPLAWSAYSRGGYWVPFEWGRKNIPEEREKK